MKMARSKHAYSSAPRRAAADPQTRESRARAGRFASPGRHRHTLSFAIGLACLTIAAIALPATAFAAPKVTVKARILPVLKNPASPNGGSYPKTGNILGAGASVEAQMTISGTEYGGFPSPLTGVVVYLPSGTKLHPQGFATCSNAILQSHEVQNCPKKSVASPKGEVLGVVSFGASRVQEKATVQAFFTPGGNIAFFTEGREPTVLEVLSTGRFSGASNPFSQKLTAVVPLVSTVPGAPYASVLSIKIRVGAAFMQGKKLISYGTVPSKCPKGGFPAKTELKYLSGETSTISIKVPCPKK
jgi:hypothetical protein